MHWFHLVLEKEWAELSQQNAPCAESGLKIDMFGETLQDLLKLHLIPFCHLSFHYTAKSTVGCLFYRIG